jgi:hypothetical protein
VAGVGGPRRGWARPGDQYPGWRGTGVAARKHPARMGLDDAARAGCRAAAVRVAGMPVALARPKRWDGDGKFRPAVVWIPGKVEGNASAVWGEPFWNSGEWKPGCAGRVDHAALVFFAATALDGNMVARGCSVFSVDDFFGRGGVGRPPGRDWPRAAAHDTGVQHSRAARASVVAGAFAGQPHGVCRAEPFGRSCPAGYRMQGSRGN